MADPAEPRLPDELDVAPAEPPAPGEELTGVEVRDAAWAGASLKQLRVDGVRIAGGDLSRATLVDPAVRDLVVEDASLANATIRGGLLRRLLVLRGRLTGITLAEAELRDAVWRDCGADLAAFRHCTLSRVTFEGCSLREADFMGASCEQVQFLGCDLTGANFAGAEFADSELRRCRIDHADGVEGLRGTTMDLDQLMALAPLLAAALGIRTPTE